MTKIKLCGLSRDCDITYANKLLPEYIGFVFAKQSKRFVCEERAAGLRNRLSKNIQAVGVFVDEDINVTARLLNSNIIDIAQLHGNEDEEYVKQLHSLTGKPVIQAFKITSPSDIDKAQYSTADFVLLDSGAGTGNTFNWDLIRNITRPYFLAGGLGINNITDAINTLSPYAVDVSSGIETDGVKDINKMAEFVAAVRKEVKI